jgi:invasion protein IalB
MSSAASHHPRPHPRRLTTWAVTLWLASMAGTALAETTGNPGTTPPIQDTTAPGTGGGDGKVFENWTLKCESAKEPQAPATANQCFIFQNLVLKEGGQRVMHIAIGYLPDNTEPVALLTLPLGISLPPGAALTVDTGEPVRFPIERCEPSGCRAGIKIDAKLLERLQKGNKAEVTFHDGSRRPIKVPLSLKGITAGLAALR